MHLTEASDTLTQLAQELGVHAPGQDLAALAEAVAARVCELRRERDDFERRALAAEELVDALPEATE